MPIRIITISRLFGAGGSSLAAALGARLGWKVLDRELIAEVARRLQRPEADVAAIDEHVLDPWQRAAVFASAAFPEMPVPPLESYLNTRVLATVEEVLQDAASAGPIIAVGHGTQCVFHDREDVLHLRVVAPFEDRVRMARQRLGLDPESARERVRAADADRQTYLRRVHGIDGSDPLHYDLVLNTRSLSVDEAADLVARIVDMRSR